MTGCSGLQRPSRVVGDRILVTRRRKPFGPSTAWARSVHPAQRIGYSTVAETTVTPALKDRSGGHQGATLFAKRTHQTNGRAVDVLQLAAPGQAIQRGQVRPVAFRHAAVGTVVHDRKRRMGAEYLAFPSGFTHIRKEMPETEDVPDFVRHRLDLFVARLVEHGRVDLEFMLARVREKRTGKHAAVRVAVCRRTDDDFEIPSVAHLDKPYRRRLAPKHQALGEEPADIVLRLFRVAK